MPGGGAVKPMVKKAAAARLGQPLTGGLLGQRPKREQSQITVKAPAAKY
jgi:hypothetical protein